MKIKKYITLIKECGDFRSKVTINYYLIKRLFHLNDRDYNPKLTQEVIIENKNGSFFCGDNMRSVWTATNKSLDDHITLKKGVFVDVGASIGTHSIRVARLLRDKGRVISIEPELNSFSLLKRNIILNELINTTILHMACLDENKKVKLYLDEIGIEANSINKDHPYLQRDCKSILVKGRRLDFILSNLNITKIDLLKIDVEGAELKVLKGSVDIIRKCKPKIIFEALDKVKVKEIKMFLEMYGYKSLKQLDKVNYLMEK